jgi:large subunit ribosomal protein L23
MSQERLLQVIRSPRVSEKTVRVQESARQYVFRVLPDATKPEIKAAVERFFKVEVEAVTTSNVKAKAVRFRNNQGSRNAWKKAYVKLKDGFEIDFLGGE